MQQGLRGVRCPYVFTQLCSRQLATKFVTEPTRTLSLVHMSDVWRPRVVTWCTWTAPITSEWSRKHFVATRPLHVAQVISGTKIVWSQPGVWSYSQTMERIQTHLLAVLHRLTPPRCLGNAWLTRSVLNREAARVASCREHSCVNTYGHRTPRKPCCIDLTEAQYDKFGGLNRRPRRTVQEMLKSALEG